MDYKRWKIISPIPTFLILMLSINTFCQSPIVHDPTQMVKDGDRYWIFNTGNGIECKSADSSDFANWRNEPRIFQGGYPDWINDYVPAFGGNFWAPGIFYLNGKWHVYYSCSTFGSQTSAIGLVTTPSISDSAWTDQGMVVHSPGTANVNAIDPHPYKDNEGRVWLLYGSYWDGIVITELDSLTGKPIDPNNLHHAANRSCEGGNLISHGDYYYLFFNRGRCCAGINSTYRILMGRSVSPTGPFYDKDSVATHEGGGSVFLHSDGRFIGPGHFGYGEDKLTYHYYDGRINGEPHLKVADLDWEDDWPIAVYSRDYGVDSGNYVISNRLSSKVIQLDNGDTLDGTNVSQYTETGDTIQRWSMNYIGDGYYKISPVLAPDKALEVIDCLTANGANVQIGTYEEKTCQHWYVAYMGSGLYRIMAAHSYRALDVLNSSLDDGANVRQRSYDQDLRSQHWRFKTPVIIESIGSVTNELNGFNLYPNPSDGSFTIDLSDLPIQDLVHIEIFSLDGKRVYNQLYSNTNSITFTDRLSRGVYMINLTSEEWTVTQKLIVN